MRTKTVVILTSDGKISDIFGNVDTTMVILDDFLDEPKNAEIITLTNRTKSYIWHGKISHSTTSGAQKDMIEQVEKLYRRPKFSMTIKRPKESILVIDTCGGYIKHAFGNSATEIIVLDENADNARKIGSISFADGLKSYLWYGIVGESYLSDDQRDWLNTIENHIKKSSQGGDLVGGVFFRGELCCLIEDPNVLKAWHAESAYRTIMRSEYANTWLFDEYVNGPGDLICNIIHLCDLCDLSFEDVMAQAKKHYDIEVAEGVKHRKRRKK